MKLKGLLYAAAFVLVLVIPVSAFAQTLTVAQMQAEIVSLMTQLQSLEQQLATAQGGTASWCHTFNTNLSIGMSGSEVMALQTALQKDGDSVTVSGTFDDQTASAITGFQEKYASQILTPNGLQNGTGYAGKSTRAKLNSLFGCGPTTTDNTDLATSTPSLPLPVPIPTPIPAPMTTSTTAIATTTITTATTTAHPYVVPPPANPPTLQTITIAAPTSTPSSTSNPPPPPIQLPPPPPITQAASGACVVRDSYTSMPNGAAASVGQGYAKLPVSGVTTLSGLQNSCTADDYAQLLTSYCAANTNPVQQEVVVYDTNGTVMSTTCGSGGCDPVSCTSQ